MARPSTTRPRPRAGKRSQLSATMVADKLNFVDLCVEVINADIQLLRTLARERVVRTVLARKQPLRARANYEKFYTAFMLVLNGLTPQPSEAVIEAIKWSWHGAEIKPSDEFTNMSLEDIDKRIEAALPLLNAWAESLRVIEERVRIISENRHARDEYDALRLLGKTHRQSLIETSRAVSASVQHNETGTPLGSKQLERSLIGKVAKARTVKNVAGPTTPSASAAAFAALHKAGRVSRISQQVRNRKRGHKADK